MLFKIQLVIEDDQASTKVEDIIQLNGWNEQNHVVGLSLLESKQLLKTVQKKIVLNQAEHYSKAHRACPHCLKKRRKKGDHTLEFRTLFGIISMPSLRLYRCPCEKAVEKTFSVLKPWLPEHTSPELQYIETKWGSLMSYGSTASLLQDVLPVSLTEKAATVRNHLHKIAQRQEKELENKPEYLSGCPRDWGKLPKPDKPITVGIDGGYVRNWAHKNTNFEIITGKAFSKTKAAKRFAFVQEIDKNPRRRLMHVLNEQGMQANQQIIFLSDGADTVRGLQYRMYPESEHVLDWFHITMRLTVLNQFAKGFVHSDPERGEMIKKELERTKWYLWHGNVDKALDCLEECYLMCDDDEIHYKNRKKFLKYIEEMDTYIRSNGSLIPNYGEKWRYGESISTGFVESTVNEVIAKRMAKKQQMQWTPSGAHYLLQTRTAVLNDELAQHFERWYPNLMLSPATEKQPLEMKKAA